MNMKSPLSASLCLLLGSAPALADITFPDFSSTAGLNLVGAAAQSGNRLRLTPAQGSLSGAAWYQTPQLVSAGFVTDIGLSITPASGADGMTFVIQNTDASFVSGSGCELGYDGLPNSVVIEIDTYSNPSCGSGPVNDPPGLHISVHTLGTAANSVDEAASLGATTSITNLADGAGHLVRIEYAQPNLGIFVDNFTSPVLVVPLDLSSVLSLANGQAFVGFTAATGGAVENHDVLYWTFTESTGSSVNHAPATPLVTEPASDGQIVSPSDVHMESSAFSDPDVSDAHRCSDWEIWRLSPLELIWRTTCIDGPERVHTHLGDGVFLGSMAGATDLVGNTDYRLRVRHADDSGEVLTEWSAYGERLFHTGSISQIYPLELEDIAAAPIPTWTQAVGGQPVVLPSGATQPSLSIEDVSAQLLLRIEGLDGQTNTQLNPSSLATHVDVRLRLSGGSSGLNLPATDLRFVDEHCDLHTLFLPALSVGPGAQAYFWVATSGSTYFGNAGQSVPDFTNLARAPEPPWVAFEPGYVVEVFATGLQLPVHIAFVPNPGTGANDPLLYVTELYGAIKVVTRDGTVGTYASGLLDYNPTGAFPGSGEQGVSGIAVDPISGDVFAAMMHDSVSSPGTHFPKVVRFSSLDGGHTAASQTTLLDMVGESQGQSHQISTLSLHPDGSLLVHMGDGFNSGTALNLNSYRGKILRMDLDGNALPDNPLYDASNGISATDYIWAYGVRNPFGGAWRAADGNEYNVENGPSTDRLTKVVAGRNFGWNGSEASMATFALYRWIPAVGPVSIAFTQPETFGGSGFPPGKMGHAFVSESGPTYASGPQNNGKRISEFVLAADGSVLSGPTPLIEYVGQHRATACGLAAGPDGLYMTDLYRDMGNTPSATGARILRVRYVGGEDCNGNGEPDFCDLASGASLDQNANGVPDECDCAGLLYCQSEPNSTGSVAQLATNGQCQVSANSFGLAASPVPNQIGIFFYGGGQSAGGAGIPFFNGRLCVAGPFQRLSPVQAAAGSASLTLDLTSPPTASGQITAGSTWNFQFWFRDPAAGGSFVNLSNARSVTFW